MSQKIRQREKSAALVAGYSGIDFLNREQQRGLSAIQFRRGNIG
jgi:hypothetical protein